MKDKHTIINEMVSNAADIMEAKLEFNELVLEQVEAKGDWAVAAELRKKNVRIRATIELIREHGGCWA